MKTIHIVRRCIHLGALGMALSACEATLGADAAGESAEDLKERGKLSPGDAVDWSGFSGGKDGLDPRFRGMKANDQAKGVVLDTKNGQQTITMNIAAGATKGSGDVALTVGAFPVAPGEYYKAWLRGTVRGSNNQGFGFCGSDDVIGGGKEGFRSQVQMAFKRANGTGTALCYCNVCPAADGDLAYCTTDQWHLNGVEVSDDGACRAPQDAASVLVTIEAVAKPENRRADIPRGNGTAVIDRFRFGRCKSDGTCDDVAPGWYGALASSGASGASKDGAHLISPDPSTGSAQSTFEEEPDTDPNAAPPLDVPGDPNDAVQAASGTCTKAIAFEKELLVRAVSVVEGADASGRPLAESGGPWSFGTLMTALAGQRSAPVMVREWLSTWEKDVVLEPAGGTPETIPGNDANVHDILIDHWPRTAGGALDLDRAPFRLLAIGYRPDAPVRDVAKGSGGEVRFVFGAIGESGRAMPMTVAFEYRIPATTEDQAAAFAKDWHDTLSAAGAVGSRSYLDALVKLTTRITKAGANPAAVNGSALAQLRTNEVAIDMPWDLRQFGLTGANGGTLALTQTPGVPRIEMNGSADLGKLLRGGVKQDSIPVAIQTGMARMPAKEWFWKPMPGVSSEIRHDFAMSTCNGCHAAETGTTFLHVHPRERGVPTQLSDFLASSSKKPLHVSDPVTKEKRTITEQDRRIGELVQLLCRP